MRISRGVPLLFTAALLLACGDDDAASSATLAAVDADGATSTTAETTTTAGEADAELKAEIEQAYYAQWDAFIEIFADPDPTNPLIDRYFTGRQRETILDSIAADVREGVVLERPSDDSLFRPRVISVEEVDGETATVKGCLVDGLIVRRRNSGAIVNDDVVTLEGSHTFVLTENVWKLEATEVVSETPGVGACAE